jgi:predicted nuclease of restriction endonuclease-like (RecB) superfamily
MQRFFKDRGYTALAQSIAGLLSKARRQAVRSVNSILTVTYWEIGRRIVGFEQKGEKRAAYGEELLDRLSRDLTARFGRGFSVDNLELMRRFYLCWPREQISETVSRKSGLDVGKIFSLPWSHYVRLVSVQNENARTFYEKEAIQGGWSVRQ